MDVTEINNIDPEYLPCCPYCEQPIFSCALVVRHADSNQLALVHQDCASQE